MAVPDLLLHGDEDTALVGTWGSALKQAEPKDPPVPREELIKYRVQADRRRALLTRRWEARIRGSFSRLRRRIETLIGELELPVIEHEPLEKSSPEIVSKGITEEELYDRLSELPPDYEAFFSSLADETIRWNDEDLQEVGIEAMLDSGREANSVLDATVGVYLPKTTDYSLPTRDWAERVLLEERFGASGVSASTNRWIHHRATDLLETGYNIRQIAYGYEGDEEKAAIEGIASRLEETYDNRARTVARTYTGGAFNLATSNRYDQNGITHVRVLDDEGPNSCEPCRQLNESIQTLKWSRQNPLEHPNCVRAFAPVIAEKETET